MILNGRNVEVTVNKYCNKTWFDDKNATELGSCGEGQVARVLETFCRRRAGRERREERWGIPHPIACADVNLTAGLVDMR